MSRGGETATEGGVRCTHEYNSVARVGNEWAFSNPIDVIVGNLPIASVDRLNRDVGLYAMDSWTMKRLTINYGLRWEQVNASNDAYSVPAGRFTPARSVPAVENVPNVPNWSNFAARFSMVYDVFGNAKTAVTYSLNRFNAAQATGIAYTYNRLTLATRTLPWTDVNGDDIARALCRISERRLRDRHGRPAQHQRHLVRDPGRRHGVSGVSTPVDRGIQPRGGARAAAARLGDGWLGAQRRIQPAQDH